MNKKTRSTKSEKWRHTCNSVEIAWTNEQKVAVTSYGRNKNHDDEIKKTKRRPIIAPAIAVRLLISKNKNFTAKTQYLNLKAPISNVEIQSDKTLLFSELYSRWKFSLMRLGNKSTKRRNNDAKFENKTFFKPNNLKIQKLLAFNKKFLINLLKVIMKPIGPVFG